MKFAYLNEIRRLLDVVEQEEASAMEQASELLFDAVTQKKSIYIFGCSHAGILSEEMYYRAGGLVVLNPIFARDIMPDTSPITHTSRMEQLVGYGTVLAEKVSFAAGDVLIIHSVSGRNPVPLEMAVAAKEKRVSVIVLTNLSYSREVTSRHPSGKRLFEVGDVVLDNHGEKGDACISVEGMEQKACPTSTVIGASILHSIVEQVTRRLVESGVSVPPIYYSANLDGGVRRNLQLIEEYSDVIHYEY